MLFWTSLAAAGNHDFAEEAKSRMKLNFDLDEIQAELAAPAAAAPRPAREQVAVPALPLEPNSTLDRVVLLRDRALVTRLRDVEGERRVRFEGLPLSIDPSSLSAEIRSGNARVVGVELVSGVGDVEETDRIAAIRADAKKRSDELGEVRDRIESLLMQRAYLRGAVLPGEGDTRPRPSVDAVKSTLGWVGDQERDLAAKLRANEERAQEMGEELEPLLTKLHNPVATGKTVRVDLDLAGDAKVEVALRYGVSGASWTPSYSARLDPDARKVTLETEALVQQWTGEAWTDASIQLSTASPVSGGVAPTLSSWLVDESGLDASALVASGSATSGAGARTFEVQGRRTIAGDGSQARIPLDSQPATSVVELTTVPRLALEVFRTADVTWMGETPLLPGPVKSFVGGDYVATGHIGAVAPGESMPIGFGADDRIRVDRTLASRKVEHLMGGRIRYTVRYRTTVHNYAKSAQAVRLSDVVPVSQVDRITVAMLDGTAPTPDPEAAPGVLCWALDLPAGGERVVELGFVVTAPRELQAQMDMMMM